MAIAQTVGQLYVNNLQIIDDTTQQLAQTVNNTDKFELRVCLKNINPDDTMWYDNISLRIIPEDNTVQFYADPAYTNRTSRFDSPLFMLRSHSSMWFTMWFKYTGVSPVSATSLKFSVGVYAHPVQILNKWQTLHHPI